LQWSCQNLICPSLCAFEKIKFFKFFSLICEDILRLQGKHIHTHICMHRAIEVK
jgi:hypothetical protein